VRRHASGLRERFKRAARLKLGDERPDALAKRGKVATVTGHVESADPAAQRSGLWNGTAHAKNVGLRRRFHSFLSEQQMFVALLPGPQSCDLNRKIPIRRESSHIHERVRQVENSNWVVHVEQKELSRHVG